MMPITTERLVLRNFRADDAEELLAYFRQPRASCFYPERLTSIQDALQSIRERNARPNGAELAVCLRANGALIGNLFSQEEEHGNHGVGWHLNPAYTGRGYAAEAAEPTSPSSSTRKRPEEFTPMSRKTICPRKNSANASACAGKGCCGSLPLLSMMNRAAPSTKIP